MKKLFLMAITGIMMACGNKPVSNNGTVEDSTSVETQDKVVATSSEPSIRETCSFSTKFRKDDEGQCDALILTINSCQDPQEFTCEFNWPKDEEYLGDAGEIEEVDLNFDGVPDLLVTLGDFGVNPDLYPLMCYAVFIWNDDEGKFTQAKELEEVNNIEVDKEKKVLVSEWMTAVGDVYHQVYAWKNGKFEMIEQTVHNEYDDEE